MFRLHRLQLIHRLGVRCEALLRELQWGSELRTLRLHLPRAEVQGAADLFRVRMPQLLKVHAAPSRRGLRFREFSVNCDCNLKSIFWCCSLCVYRFPMADPAAADSASPTELAPSVAASSRPAMTSKQRAAAKRAHASKLKAKKQAKRAQNKVEARAASASMHPQAAEDDGTFDADGAGDTSEDVADAGSLVLTEDYRSWDEAQQDAFIDSIVAALRLRCCREGTSPGDATSLYVPAVESSSSNNNKSTGSNRGGGRAGTEAGSWFEGANAINSFFLDDFLFSREARLDLIDRGQLELFFCTKCDRTLQGDSRRKSDEQKLKEERERNKLIDAIKQKHQQARRGENDSAGAATSSSSSSVSQLLSSAIHAVGSSFSLLALSKKVDAPAKNLDPVEDASSLAAEIAAVPPVSAELFPRFNAQPSYCRYCHASSGSIHVRTHMTHSLAMQQSNDMFRELVNPHIRFDEGIGSKAVAAYAAGMKKRKAKANVAAASAAPPTTVSLSSDLLDSSDSALPYAVDIGSRLGNMLYCGVIYSACPRWVGVELDSFFATESARIIRMCGPLMQRVCRVEECDVSLRVSLLRGAKLVCFFNCFELHVTRERHRELLQFLRDSICERGQYVLSCPSLKDIFGRAESTVDLEEWVSLEASKDDAFIYRVK